MTRLWVTRRILVLAPYFGLGAAGTSAWRVAHRFGRGAVCFRHQSPIRAGRLFPTTTAFGVAFPDGDGLICPFVSIHSPRPWRVTFGRFLSRNRLHRLEPPINRIPVPFVLFSLSLPPVLIMSPPNKLYFGFADALESPPAKKVKPSSPGGDSPAYVPAIQALMAGVKDSPDFVPETGPVTQENFAEFSGPDKGTILRARRPLSVKASACLAEVFTLCIQRHGDAFLSRFGDGDLSTIDEIREMYVVGGHTIPEPLSQLRRKIGKGLKDQVKRELRVSATPLMKSRKALRDLQQRCQEVFGVGLAVITAPVRFLHATADLPLDRARAQLAQRVEDTKSLPGAYHSGSTPGKSTPSLGATPDEGIAVEGDKTNVTPPTPTAPERLETKFAAGKPNFVPEQATVMARFDGWLWVPIYEDWLLTQATMETSPPKPASHWNIHTHGDWIWFPQGKEWVKVKLPH